MKILDIRNSTGGVACALFESSEGFPNEYLRFATKIMVIKIRDKQARCDFEDIPPGTYALAVVHDEDMNGKLDTKWLAIPTEDYGFSNDARALIGAPSFSAASFQYDGKNLELTIGLNYLSTNGMNAVSHGSFYCHGCTDKIIADSIWEDACRDVSQ